MWYNIKIKFNFKENNGKPLTIEHDHLRLRNHPVEDWRKTALSRNQAEHERRAPDEAS